MPKGIFCGKGKGKKLKAFLKQESNTDLRGFTENFFCALKKSNPAREEHEVSAEEEILDVIARLLVGDETCAAIAISGQELLLATNESKHIDDCLVYQRAYRILQRKTAGVRPQSRFSGAIRSIGLSYTLEFTDTIEHRSSVQPLVAISKKSGPVQYQLNFTDQIFQIVKGNPEIKFSHDELGIPCRAGDMPICFPVKLKQNAVDFNALCNDPLKKDLAMFRPQCVYLNPLRRRAAKLIRLLALIAHSILTRPEMEGEVHDYLEQHNEWAQFLRDSLSYELARLREYKEYIDPYSFPAPGEPNAMNDMLRFYEWLAADYQRYRKETGQVTSVVSISRWIEYVAANIEKDIIPAPTFIKVNPCNFIKLAREYFTRLVRVENFIAIDAKKKGKLARILVDERLFEKGMACLRVVDGIDKVHAEMRLLEYHLQHHPDTRNYYGITMLCCALCTHTMKQFNVADYRGSHATLFAGWGLGEFLEQQKYLKIFLGELWSDYERLKGRTCRLSDDKPDEEDSHEKTAVVLEIIPAVSGINSREAFEELHISEEYLLPQPMGESLYPHDSDDSEELGVVYKI